MSVQFSSAVRNARINAIETTVGTTPQLILYSGAEAANCAASDPAGVLATLTLPSTWEGTASGGVAALSGTWSGTASASGTVASFRLKDSTGTTCHMQGTVTATGSGGDLTLDNPAIVSGQTINILTFSLTDGNA